MDHLFAGLIFKIHCNKLLKSKSKIRNDPTYDFSGLLSIADEDFSA
ncbi:hypothetical protein AAA799D07_00163 [Marine Group I thaumarchaeote SCGC AAA799-D07]|nr:hypothetical protein AAA799D07_00163 [Marine Group I thaumarchaeote SCGC AAA799-D07]